MNWFLDSTEEFFALLKNLAGLIAGGVSVCFYFLVRRLEHFSSKNDKLQAKMLKMEQNSKKRLKAELEKERRDASTERLSIIKEKLEDDIEEATS